MDNFTFRQYLKESGYDKMSYQEEVYTTCLGLGNYQNIDLYYQDEIDEGYEQNVPVNELAARLCAQFDKDYGTPKDEEIPEFEEEEYSQETLDAMADYPQDTFDDYDFSNDFNESTETEETFDDWKGYVFKYLDKRVDVNKIKELGTYIKDFIKQEWDNGEPSWFAAAESIVNYARTNYPQAVKPRESNALSITENKVNEARLSNKQKALAELEEYFGISANGDTIYTDGITRQDEIEIGNICYKYNVDFALGSKHVTVYAKTRNEAFIQDDRGTVNIEELKTAILKKADLIYDDGDPKGEIAKYNLSDAFVVIGAANYIAALYAKQSMPKNGMIAWGVRDIKSFVNRFNNGGADAAIRGTRSVLVGKPPKDLENQYIERVKAAIRKQNADAEEKRRQAYLNSEEHRHMQDPGWRGPRGTWSND